MSTSNYIIHEHVVPAQHIRELPNSTAVSPAKPDATLHLAVKQYVPKNNPEPTLGDVTIIALHANNYHKEIYEPLWDDLLESLPNNVRVRSIWMADMAQMGSSYVLNEDKLADGVSWDDHARDLLYLVNFFRDQMVPPILGIGHSMGAAQLVQLCKLHPRLCASVALLDPWFSMNFQPQNPKTTWKRMTQRRDEFSSRDDAKAKYAKSPFFKTWDPRCFQRYIETGFRDLPTLLHNEGKGVTPTTPLEMELYSSVRPNLDHLNTDPDTASRTDRLLAPDMRYDLPLKWPFYVPAIIDKASYLPHLRPRTLYLYGKTGSIIRPEWRQPQLEATGVGHGGSGGARLGCVADDVVPGGHFFPFETPKGTAERLARWLKEEQAVWLDETTMLDRKFVQGRSAEQRQKIPARFKELNKTWEKKPSKL